MYDVAVIGAGIIGSAAAYVLGKQGKKTLLLDQFPLPHSRGSSYGASRATHHANPDLFTSAVMNLADSMWAELERESGMKLFRQTGMLITSRTQHQKLAYYHSLVQSYCKQTVPLANSDVLSKDFHPMRFPATESGCLDPTAGVLYASKCLQAFQRVFESNGGVIKDGHKVTEVIPGETLTIRTNRGSYQAKGVVISCGPWSTQLLTKLGLHLPLTAESIQVPYWKIKTEGSHDKLPVFITYFDGYSIYGLPPDEYPDMMKICLHNGRACDPDFRDQVDEAAEVKDMKRLEEYVSQVFPDLIAEPAIKERCIYTCTPDSVCIVDRHPKHSNIVYAVGFSGMGFKQAPVIGLMLSDLLQEKTNPLLVKEMRADRFNAMSHL